MDYKIKLGGTLPKGDLNGWGDRNLAEDIGRQRLRQAAERPRVAIVLYEVTDTGVGKLGVITTKLELSRVQPVLTEDGLRAVEALLAAEYTDQHGCQQPYEVQALAARAFVGLPRTTSEIDQREAAEADLMSPTDELRRHLERVHGRTDAGELTAMEADQVHESDHAGDMPGELDHDREWRGWTRVDLEAAAAEAADGEAPDSSGDEVPRGTPYFDPANVDDDPDDPDRAQDYNPDDEPAGDNVLPLFSSDRV